MQPWITIHKMSFKWIDLHCNDMHYRLCLIHRSTCVESIHGKSVTIEPQCMYSVFVLNDGPWKYYRDSLRVIKYPIAYFIQRYGIQYWIFSKMQFLLSLYLSDFFRKHLLNIFELYQAHKRLISIANVALWSIFLNENSLVNQVRKC